MENSFLRTQNFTFQLNYSNDRFAEKEIFVIINCFIYSICAILSTILNIPLIINWIVFCKKDNYSDLLLISIALTGLIDGIFVCPIHLTKKLKELHFIRVSLSEFVEFLEESIDDAIFPINFLSMLILSLHRLRLLKVPFKEQTKINRFRIASIISIWLTCIIASFLEEWYLYYIRSEKLLRFMFIIITLYIPTVSVIVINILIIINFIAKMKNQNLNRVDFKKEKKAILCTLSITLAISLTFGMYSIFYPFKIYDFEFEKYLHDLYYSLGYSFTFLNPLIVLIFNKKLRIKLTS